MPDHGNDDLPVRRYSDAEVRLLLERAARMQGRAPAAVRPQGLTLEQLEEIAAEARIDVTNLRQAARELDVERSMRPVSAVERLVGSPLRIVAEHTLPFELAADSMGALVNSIGVATGEQGTSGLVGRTFTWTAKHDAGRRLDVRVSVQRGRTHVWIEERYSELAGGLFGGVLGGVGGGVGFGAGTAIAAALGSVAVGIAFPVAVIAGCYGACRFGFGAYVRTRARRISALCEQIVRDIRALHEGD
ncbi:MAG TPA: hypothetical protein VFZ69_02245 [Longimicrobiales bacterium]